MRRAIKRRSRLIGLAGMDMRKTVILIDQIEADVRDRGLAGREAIVFSTMRRARPAGPDRARGDPGNDPALAQRILGSRWPSPSWAACGS
jgi:hypothetical protein